MPNEMEDSEIQYLGTSGATEPCVRAVRMILQFGEDITKAALLTCNGDHAFLLTIGEFELAAIRSGFTSGYAGEGPRGLSYTLQLLDFHGTQIDEYRVPQELLDRLNASSLTQADLVYLQRLHPVRPLQWYRYIWDDHRQARDAGKLWHRFPDIIPYSIVEPRLTDLALAFWANPDDALLRAYRRLEDRLRGRTGSAESGTRLFSDAFMPPNGPLIWADVPEAEQRSRAQLFIHAYATHRNPRAHRELDQDSPEHLQEFLVVNLLYRLEAQAQERALAENTGPAAGQ